MMLPPNTSREHLHPSSISENTVRSAPYSYRAPSPPFIHIPVPQRVKSPQVVMELLPSFKNVDPTQLTSQDVQIITRNAKQIALDRAADWEYENRRLAQAIVDFLYLGPTSAIRDHGFLQREGITMMLVVRSTSMAGAKPLSVEKASGVLGIPAHYIHVDGSHDLIHAFPEMISLINNHLLFVYHSQARGGDRDGQISVPQGGFRPGKVLVTCESGNDRSAAVVAAYIMAVFGNGMIPTLQFIGLQRFCCTFDEETKRILQSWEDILLARSTVAKHMRHQMAEASQNWRSCPAMEGGTPQIPSGRALGSKRGLDDMMDLSSENCEDAGGALIVDLDRFTDRDSFAPFADAVGGGSRG